MPLTVISGWDIGGAHLKGALTNAQGQIIRCTQVCCPLWQGLDHLLQAFEHMKIQLGGIGDLVAITMTGELADIFKDRHQGVQLILECVEQFFSPMPVYVFAGTQGFIPLGHASKYIKSIASANYLATSQLAARHWDQGLIIDIGSTTSDLIPCKAGKPHPQGKNDHTRLISGELVYSGVIRTPLMAIVQQAPIEGRWVRLAAEHFATTADIYHLLGWLPKGVDLYPSADHQGKSPEDCARRLARMIGADSQQESFSSWRKLAFYFAEQQCQQLTQAIFQVLSRINLKPEAPIIGAGIGRFLAIECARRVHRPYVDFAEILKMSPHIPINADHAPAAAITQLAWEQLQNTHC
ncbi:H4MPT-linked C1 transfer pathway protein [Candidatus Nitrosoglobus terrae]|uniref:H4MPT-linked C1 transfer pathway protein n=1 Tax=Candidatus Nitrosoglobus terrae TaxID=1630141 RepID=A0A1Q2SPR3_9GAMM|nr:hydantoinase/oxoprolinase family protein [Candidatus Nitrosoglobus terrae]BAW81130.1 H4MPT-linked C1 transfer pathway protein [Candidatus Nitrosoglobus terrae]